MSIFINFIPTRLLITLSGKRTIYPFYHIVSDNPPIHIRHLYPIKTVEQFEKDLDFLQKHFSASVFPVKNNNPQFVLSFDDGLSEVYDTIAPILVKRNIPAIFFINSGFTDNKDLFFKYKISIIIEELNKNKIPEDLTNILNCKKLRDCRNKLLLMKFSDNKTIDKIAEILKIDFKDYLKTKKPYLSKTQISKLINDGFKIGAHSINHHLFSEINFDKQIKQTEDSINFIQRNFKTDKKLFAFPFSDYGVSDAYFKTVFEKNIADFTFGTAGIKDDIFEKNIQRIPTEKYGLSAKRHIKTEYLRYMIKKNMVKR